MAEKKNGAPADRAPGKPAVERRATPRGKRAATPGAEKPDRPAVRLLVVDDDQVDRMAVRRALGRMKVASHVAEADAVLSAIDLLGSEHFDCVFLDYNLPDGDGLTFLRGLRTAGIVTPVVMLTGQQDEGITSQLVESGAADYIAKADLTPARLLVSLRRVLPGL